MDVHTPAISTQSESTTILSFCSFHFCGFHFGLFWHIFYLLVHLSISNSSPLVYLFELPYHSIYQWLCPSIHTTTITRYFNPIEIKHPYSSISQSLSFLYHLPHVILCLDSLSVDLMFIIPQYLINLNQLRHSLFCCSLLSCSFWSKFYCNFSPNLSPQCCIPSPCSDPIYFAYCFIYSMY